MSCDVGHRHGSDPTLLWQWCRPAAAAPIRPLAWKLPYAAGSALKKKKRQRERERERIEENVCVKHTCVNMCKLMCEGGKRVSELCACVCICESGEACVYTGVGGMCECVCMHSCVGIIFPTRLWAPQEWRLL